MEKASFIMQNAYIFLLLFFDQRLPGDAVPLGVGDGVTSDGDVVVVGFSSSPPPPPVFSSSGHIAA